MNKRLAFCIVTGQLTAYALTGNEQAHPPEIIYNVWPIQPGKLGIAWATTAASSSATVT
jgi:hypothetical protein